MKIRELLSEAYMDSEIKKIMTKKGYKFLGHGQDQDAYLAPDGTILKIFGYEEGSSGLSRGQKSFIDFANYCMQNPNNQFLPQFGGWEQFEFKGELYLQIKCERMFDIDVSKTIDIAEMLEELAHMVAAWGVDKGLKRFMENELYANYSSPESVGKMITLIGGEEQLKVFAKTVEDLYKLAQSNRYRLDLHSGNFMLGSDGEIVINDPFFTGYFR